MGMKGDSNPIIHSSGHLSFDWLAQLIIIELTPINCTLGITHIQSTVQSLSFSLRYYDYIDLVGLIHQKVWHGCSALANGWYHVTWPIVQTPDSLQHLSFTPLAMTTQKPCYGRANRLSLQVGKFSHWKGPTLSSKQGRAVNPQCKQQQATLNSRINLAFVTETSKHQSCF